MLHAPDSLGPNLPRVLLPQHLPYSSRKRGTTDIDCCILLNMSSRGRWAWVSLLAHKGLYPLNRFLSPSLSPEKSLLSVDIYVEVYQRQALIHPMTLNCPVKVFRGT